VGAGLHEAMREVHGPFGGFEARTELGWAYEGELDPDWELDPTGIERAAIDLRGRWEREYLPRVHAITEEIQRIRPERPPPHEAERLVDRMWALMLEQWTIHFLVVVPAQIAVEMLNDAYTAAFAPEDPLIPYRLLEGVSNESAEADGHLWRLAEQAEALGVSDILAEYPPDAVRDRLAELQNGRRFLRELDGYLLSYGGRCRWHEVSLRREIEGPHMTLESIRLFLERRARPKLARAAEAARLEEEALAGDPGLAPTLRAAKFGYALKETHAYHIDYPGLLAIREVLLGFGRRLTAEGRLAELDDVWMLRRHELRRAVADPRMVLEDLIAERRAELAAGLAEGPRPFLGEPPAQEERHAALEKFYGSGAAEASGRSLRGTGASPGTAEGAVRIVVGPEDFRRVRAGDVLIATTTTPAWTPLFPSLSALVTETGGILSHAAIVAREYGIPAVVGLKGATRLLAERARVRVDGSTGDVELL
jgi:rifampicin phosphotransferase